MEDTPLNPSTEPALSVEKPQSLPQPVKHHHPLAYLGALILFVIGVVLGFFLVQLMPDQTTKVPVKEETAAVTLPTDAQQIQACADHKGALYIQPKNINPKDRPIGPVYMVNKGKVIGMEFMVAKDDIMQEKSFADLQGLGMKIDHVNIEPEPTGHEGFSASHYHLDFYSVPRAVEQAIVCPGGSNDASSGAMMNMMPMEKNSSASSNMNMPNPMTPVPTSTMPAKMQ